MLKKYVLFVMMVALLSPVMLTHAQDDIACLTSSDQPQMIAYLEDNYTALPEDVTQEAFVNDHRLEVGGLKPTG